LLILRRLPQEVVGGSKPMAHRRFPDLAGI